MPRRLSICYAAPGHSLLETSGPTRNVLSLAECLSKWADVTVAFRSIRQPISASKYRVIAIEPDGEKHTAHKDDVAIRGLDPLAHMSYLQKLRSFSRECAGAYDLVLEKGWRLSGCLVCAFRQQGVPGVLVENDARYWNEPIEDLRSVVKYSLHKVSRIMSGFYCRRVPVIIVETEELKTALVKHLGVSADRVEVVGLGVDHCLFYPMEQRSIRDALGIDPSVTVLLYVGGMDKYHDLDPLIEALARVRLSSLELHLVGDGILRTQYEEKARRAQITVRCHGKVPHTLVPKYIAAADLCLAPYCTNAFYNGVVTFSTLKIPEYMACARPVISIPSGHIAKLIEHQVSGFVLPNEVPSWVSFLEKLPSRERLENMGRAAARAVESVSWEKTAARYLEVCQRLTTARFSSLSEAYKG